VLCPDLVGRGLSDRLMNPADYDLPQYVVDMTVLISSLGASEVDWIGTSLGGLIGIVMAGLPRSPIRRLVINDVGPYLPFSAVLRIGRYISTAPGRFASAEAAEAYFRDILAPFGKLPDWQWQHLTKHSVVPDSGSGCRLRYDRRLTRAFKPPSAYTRKLWSLWDRIRCPVLVLRGVDSDLLLSSTAAEMARRGPKATVVEIPGCGHAPTLFDAGHIRIVSDWLAEHGQRGEHAARAF
jgi:pimeloyl-ACP methyl ester carboxylesterase